MKEITKRQRQVLMTIEQFCHEHGYSPSVRELASSLGIESPSAIFKHIHSLAAKGYLKHEEKSARSIQVVDQKTSSPKIDGEIDRKSTLVPLIGSISKGQKLEFFTTEEHIAFPAHFFKKQLPSYAFVVKDRSFESDNLLQGDIIAVQAKNEVEAQDKVLAIEEITGITIVNGNALREKSTQIQILGVIMAMIRSWGRYEADRK